MKLSNIVLTAISTYTECNFLTSEVLGKVIDHFLIVLALLKNKSETEEKFGIYSISQEQ